MKKVIFVLLFVVSVNLLFAQANEPVSFHANFDFTMEDLKGIDSLINYFLNKHHLKIIHDLCLDTQKQVGVNPLLFVKGVSVFVTPPDVNYNTVPLINVVVSTGGGAMETVKKICSYLKVDHNVFADEGNAKYTKINSKHVIVIVDDKYLFASNQGDFSPEEVVSYASYVKGLNKNPLVFNISFEMFRPMIEVMPIASHIEDEFKIKETLKGLKHINITYLDKNININVEFDNKEFSGKFLEIVEKLRKKALDLTGKKLSSIKKSKNEMNLLARYNPKLILLEGLLMNILDEVDSFKLHENGETLVYRRNLKEALRTANSTGLIGVLYAITVPGFEGARENAIKNACRANCRIISCAFEMYDMDQDKPGKIDKPGLVKDAYPQLIKGGYIKDISSDCKAGGEYHWTGKESKTVTLKNGKTITFEPYQVYCTVHGSPEQ